MPSPASDLETLRARFRDAFASDPTFVASAPGRVNLIGEHVDYAGLPVMPIAIDRRITLVGRPRDDTQVRLVTLRDGSHRNFAATRDIPPGPGGDWGNYPRAAARALARHAGSVRGLDGIIASDLPAAAGLSSSSALVVAVGLALADVNDLAIDPLELAGLLAEGERDVGTLGGAMDQTVCLTARHGHAARIDFNPPAVTHVPVPDDWCFIVADSLEQAEKSGGAQQVYNARTREIEVARMAVTDALEIGNASYRELSEGYATTELIATARRALDRTLFQRFRHVVTEADRVVAAESALRRDDLLAFGGLLDDAHASLRDDYEVSTDRLDHLTALAMDAGAAGARLTGAGLGGCALAVCSVRRAPEILAALERGFYARLGARTPPEGRLFTVEPAAAATVRSL